MALKKGSLLPVLAFFAIVLIASVSVFASNQISQGRLLDPCARENNLIYCKTPLPVMTPQSLPAGSQTATPSAKPGF